MEEEQKRNLAVLATAARNCEGAVLLPTYARDAIVAASRLVANLVQRVEVLELAGDAAKRRIQYLEQLQRVAS